MFLSELVGCFTPGEGPLAHLNTVPEDPELVQTDFHIWLHSTTNTTATNIDEQPTVIIPAKSVRNFESLLPNFDPALPFYVIIHGFGDSVQSIDGWSEVMRARLQARMVSESESSSAVKTFSYTIIFQSDWL